jgi:predicted dienelactone hydrolase
VRGSVALCASLAALCAPAAALAQDPPPGTPQWQAREAQNFADASGRVQDWSANPDAPPNGSTDPLRAAERWNGARGQVISIEYRNRYKARIAAHLWRPKNVSAPLPAVVFVNGYGSGQDPYFWAAEDLAEHGYLVMTFDPQGEGHSDSQPAQEYCQPGGAWTRPQEMGITEQGSCAGQDPPNALTGQGTSASFVATGRLGNEDTTGAAEVYRAIAPRFVFGTLDAVAYLLSAQDPWRAQVDPARVGVVGHSAGAWAALMVANGDPLRRFRTGVSLDAYHRFDFGVHGTAPTLLMQSEQENVLGPRAVPPSDPRSPNQLHPARAVFSDLRARGIDTGFYVLRSSTHEDFSDAYAAASREGQRVAGYLTLAWLDAHLRDGAAAQRGRVRLHADRFDASIDASSIGTGTYDPAHGNVPSRIAGEPVADHLSFYYPSDLYEGGRLCLDLRVNPCPLEQAPATPRCASRRAFTIHLPRLSAVRVTLDGRRVLVRRSGRRLVARIDLRGSPRRVPVVRIVGRTASGLVVRQTRRYHPCTFTN